MSIEGVAYAEEVETAAEEVGTDDEYAGMSIEEVG